MTHRYRLISGPALVAAGFVIALLSAPHAAEANKTKILYSFPGGAGGSSPQGDLITSKGALYGTTFYGGGSHNCLGGCGTIYRIAGGQVSVLYAFRGGSDGFEPAAGLLADDEGNLFGATRQGGQERNGDLGYGTVFKLGPDGTKSVLYTFTGESNGEEPRGALVADDEGNLYGTTHYGGNVNDSCLTGCGTVFKVTPEGQQSVLHAFSGVPVGDGAGPNSNLIADAAGNLYGTTFAGGKIFGGSAPCYTFGCGTVFKLTPDGEVTVLHAFEGGSDGAWPVAGLIADLEGNLYGATSAGGGNDCVVGCGTVFKMTPQGTVTVLHSFGDGSEGRQPGRLIADTQGNLYGAAAAGGANDGGTVFKLTPGGALSVLYDFRAFRGDAETPVGQLTVDSRGNLLGTSYVGGASHKGTIFKVQN